MTRPIRVAARALIVIEGRLLLVNAYSGDGPNLWCAPGGGCEVGEAMTDTLTREVMEETGLPITPGDLAGISEFHNPDTGFHQVEMFFYATPTGPLPDTWTDPEGVVHMRRLFRREELVDHPHKPDALAGMAFDRPMARYLGLRRMVRRRDLAPLEESPE